MRVVRGRGGAGLDGLAGRVWRLVGGGWAVRSLGVVRLCRLVGGGVGGWAVGWGGRIEGCEGDGGGGCVGLDSARCGEACCGG